MDCPGDKWVILGFNKEKEQSCDSPYGSLLGIMPWMGKYAGNVSCQHCTADEQPGCVLVFTCSSPQPQVLRYLIC